MVKLAWTMERLVMSIPLLGVGVSDPADIMETHHIRLEALGLGDAKAGLVRAVEETDALAQQTGLRNIQYSSIASSAWKLWTSPGTAENQQVFARLFASAPDVLRIPLKTDVVPVAFRPECAKR